MRNIVRNIKDLLQLTFKKAMADDIITQGAAIAFYTIFSVAPLFVLVVAVSSFFLSEEVITQQVTVLFGDFIDDDMLEYLNEILVATIHGQGGLITTIIALGTVIFGATTVINQLKVSLNKIWNVSEIKIHSVWNFLFNRLLSFGMILLFSLLLLASLIAEASLAITTGFFSDLLPNNIQLNLFQHLSQVVTIAFAILFFTLIFKILPDVHIRWKDVLVGAVVTTFLFWAGKYLIGIYLSATGIEVTYRAAGALVIFVIWVYYNIQTILLGAVFTQVYTSMFGGRILPYRFVSLK